MKVDAEHQERFRRKTWYQERHQCWLWVGSKNDAGYGWFCLNGKTTKAHRVAWMIHTGDDIPKGVCVLHSCDKPSCVNPAHLFLGTKADNNKDRSAKGRTHKLSPERARQMQARCVETRKESGTYKMPLKRNREGE